MAEPNGNAKGDKEVFGAMVLGAAPDLSHPASPAAAGG